MQNLTVPLQKKFDIPEAYVHFDRVGEELGEAVEADVHEEDDQDDPDDSVETADSPLGC